MQIQFEKIAIRAEETGFPNNETEHHGIQLSVLFQEKEIASVRFEISPKDADWDNERTLKCYLWAPSWAYMEMEPVLLIHVPLSFLAQLAEKVYGDKNA